MKESLYSRRSNLVVGFHGCDKSVVDAVIAGKTELLASANDYDWLGNGIYFWENNEDRAWQWAKQLSTRKSSSVKEPAVIGAIIDLGYCLDLTDSFYLPSNPQPIGFSGILLAKRQNSFYCTYFLHNRNVADTKSPYPIKRLEVIRWFNQKSMVFNQSLS